MVFLLVLLVPRPWKSKRTRVCFLLGTHVWLVAMGKKPTGSPVLESIGVLFG